MATPGSLPAAPPHCSGTDPDAGDLMDPRTPQPADGLCFGSVLPVGLHEALAEYTEFSPRALPAGGATRPSTGHTSAGLQRRPDTPLGARTASPAPPPLRLTHPFHFAAPSTRHRDRTHLETA
ncbi:lycopene cyclase family protein [Streptomyces olivaceoviridis]